MADAQDNIVNDVIDDEIRSENELILKENTNYLVKLTSRVASNYITTHINGYICGIGG